MKGKKMKNRNNAETKREKITKEKTRNCHPNIKWRTTVRQKSQYENHIKNKQTNRTKTSQHDVTNYMQTKGKIDNTNQYETYGTHIKSKTHEGRNNGRKGVQSRDMSVYEEEAIRYTIKDQNYKERMVRNASDKEHSANVLNNIRSNDWKLKW